MDIKQPINRRVKVLWFWITNSYFYIKNAWKLFCSIFRGTKKNHAGAHRTGQHQQWSWTTPTQKMEDYLDNLSYLEVGATCSVQFIGSEIKFSEPTYFELKVLRADCVPWKGRRKMSIECRSMEHSRTYTELSFA